jgi:uncharacterized SAM-binding protein YcdF (DUF218 family)
MDLQYPVISDGKELSEGQDRFAPRLKRWRRRLAVAVLAAGFLGTVAFLFRAPLLTGLARAWMVHEPAAEADAILILGGGLENRPFAAAQLYRAGIAPRILYLNVQPGPVEELGLALSEAEQTRRILLKQGVPETALTPIGDGVASTYDEARALREWLGSNDAKRIIIPTDVFHTRRVRWIFNKYGGRADVSLHVVAIDPVRYNATNWWQREEGVIALQNEWLKTVYYRLKY